MLKDQKCIISSAAAIILLIIIISTAFLLSTPKILAAENTQVTKESVRVFLGAYKSVQKSDSAGYVEQREEILSKNAKANPSGENKALLTFSEYKDIDDIKKLLSLDDKQVNVKIEEVYMWVPGNTGRAIIVVSDNDIAASVQHYIDILKHTEGNSPELMQDISALEQKGKIFALTVTAPNSVLAGLAGEDQIFADPFQHDEAAAYARNNNKSLSFICLPDKPDNCS